MKKLFMLMVVLLVALSPAAFAYCGGGFPGFYDGAVTIDGVDAPVGTNIKAYINGELKTDYTTTTAGIYGEPANPFGVPGDAAGYDDPAEVSFLIDGTYDPGETSVYACGESETLDLTVLTGSVECTAGPDCGLTSCFELSRCIDGTYTEFYDVGQDCVDNVCVDMECTDFQEFVTDADADGFDTECDGDWDDNDATSYPGAPEICDDGIDNNNDGLTDGEDTVNCPAEPNDADGDGVFDNDDNCVDDANPGQEDADADGMGDVCDVCPNDVENDADADGFCESVDTCPLDYNPGQELIACDDNAPQTTINTEDGWNLFALPYNPVVVDDTEGLMAMMAAQGVTCTVAETYSSGSWVTDVAGLDDASIPLTGTTAYFMNCDAGSFVYPGEAW